MTADFTAAPSEEMFPALSWDDAHPFRARCLGCWCLWDQDTSPVVCPECGFTELKVISR